MANNLGVSFFPSQQQQEANQRGGGAAPQRAVQTLSMRLPRVMGSGGGPAGGPGGQIAPASLLAGQGAGGNPLLSNDRLLRALLMLSGMKPTMGMESPIPTMGGNTPSQGVGMRLPGPDRHDDFTSPGPYRHDDFTSQFTAPPPQMNWAPRVTPGLGQTDEFQIENQDTGEQVGTPSQGYNDLGGYGDELSPWNTPDWEGRRSTWDNPWT